MKIKNLYSHYSICILLWVGATLFSSCNKQSIEAVDKTNNHNLVEEADKIAKQLGFDVSIKNVMVENRINFQCTENNSLNLDLEKAITIIFALENGDSIISTTIPIINSDSIYYNIIERGSFQYAMVVYSSYDYASNKVIMQQLVDCNEKTPPIICVPWLDCMKNLFASDVGAVIQIGGVAGGLGCVACAAVAGFLTGVGALGCAG